MGDPTAAVYATRDKMIARYTQEMERAKGAADPRTGAMRVEGCQLGIEMVTRVAELVATWEPLPTPAPATTETVQEWQQVLTLPFERTRGEWEEQRRHSAVQVNGKPVKQSIEVAAERLFALVSHKASSYADGWTLSTYDYEKTYWYVQVFGDKDIGKLSPRNVSAKIPAYMLAVRDTNPGLMNVIRASVPNAWDMVIQKMTQRHVARARINHPKRLADPPHPTDPNQLDPNLWTSHLPKGRLFNAIARELRRDIPREARAARSRELECIFTRIAILDDQEFEVACKMVAGKLAASVTTTPWSGADEDADVDALVDALLTSHAWARGALEVVLDANSPLLQSGRWALR